MGEVVRSGGDLTVERGGGDAWWGDRSSLSLAGDAWPAAAPGGVAGERERERGREGDTGVRESER